MSRKTNAFVAFALLAVICLAAGCQTTATPQPLTNDPNVGLDPCADQLHDICGRFLVYYSTYRQLPKTIAVLDEKSTSPTADLVCPISGKPYIYNRTGLNVSGGSGKLIVYDAEPCHSGKRWGILAEPSRPGKPLVLRVMCLSDSLLLKPKSAAPTPPQ